MHSQYIKRLKLIKKPRPRLPTRRGSTKPNTPTSISEASWNNTLHLNLDHSWFWRSPSPLPQTQQKKPWNFLFFGPCLKQHNRNLNFNSKHNERSKRKPPQAIHWNVFLEENWNVFQFYSSRRWFRSAMAKNIYESTKIEIQTVSADRALAWGKFSVQLHRNSS